MSLTHSPFPTDRRIPATKPGISFLEYSRAFWRTICLLLEITESPGRRLFWTFPSSSLGMYFAKLCLANGGGGGNAKQSFARRFGIPFPLIRRGMPEADWRERIADSAVLSLLGESGFLGCGIVAFPAIDGFPRDNRSIVGGCERMGCDGFPPPPDNVAVAAGACGVSGAPNGGGEAARLRSAVEWSRRQERHSQKQDGEHPPRLVDEFVWCHEVIVGFLAVCAVYNLSGAGVKFVPRFPPKLGKFPIILR